MKIREYLKLARSFNAVLTGISPVMGAIAMQEYRIWYLLILFLAGFFGHTYGFVFNDVIDYRIDKSSKEISDRPLISGTISIKNALFFAFISMILAFVFAFIIAFNTGRFFPIILLGISGLSITLYDFISKKYPFTDIFVALGIFFLILYGALTVNSDIYKLTTITWFVAVLGSIQVLFMQIVAGGMKDIENDFKKGAKTLAIRMGVRIVNGDLKVSSSYKFLAYFIQVLDIIVVFLPFYVIPNFTKSFELKIFQWVALILVAIIMFYLSYKLLSMKQFKREKARKFIGSHYITNFTLVPILLISINPWAGLLVFFPALGFIVSNLIVHGTLLQPKTM